MKLETIINEFFWELEKQYPPDHPMIRKFGFIDTYKEKIQDKLCEIESNIDDIIAEVEETKSNIEYWKLDLLEKGIDPFYMLASLDNIQEICKEIV